MKTKYWFQRRELRGFPLFKRKVLQFLISDFLKKKNQELDFLVEIHQLGDGFRVLLQNPKYPFQNLNYIQISQSNEPQI